MTEIIPAILAKNFEELHNKISRVVDITKVVQIDICDGVFVPSRTWPMNKEDEHGISSILNEEEGLPYWDSLDFEFDLMVKNAILQFDFFARLGAKRIIFHIEAEEKDKLKEFIEGLDMYVRDNLEIGIAINTNTHIDEIKSIISCVDFVQCMGIEHLGFQGEPFDERVLKQISSLRELYPEITISVDGGVKEETAPLLVKAGANRLVVGSLLIQSIDIRETMKELENL